MKVAIIDYGAGNIKSIQFALERLGTKGVLTSDKEKIQTAEHIIFPGVGEASSAMKKLKATSLDKLIPQLKQPVLGICLGMQLMCTHSEEGHTEGLAIFDVAIQRFSKGLKTPQIGWNTIEQMDSPLFENIAEKEYMYLIHSYYAPLCSQTIATATYEEKYSVALQHNNFYGVQFHPEKSSKTGAIVLQNFLNL